jgi:hypothetical protein
MAAKMVFALKNTKLKYYSKFIFAIVLYHHNQNGGLIQNGVFSKIDFDMLSLSQFQKPRR